MNHHGIPQLGLGTFGRTGEEGTRALVDAIEVGYRHFDTAQSYGTEGAVGEAIRRSGIPRHDVFVTTKIATVNLGRAAASIGESLEALGTDYIDLLLIHWPSPGDALPFVDYMQALAEAKAKGLARRIGVSNFPIAQMQRAEALLGKGAIVANQVEVHPFLQSRKLRAWCAGAGIAVTAYLPIARYKVAEEVVTRTIAARHAATPAQVTLAFLLAEGLICIPSSARRERMVENFGALQLRLEPGDCEAMRSLDRGERIIDPATAPAWDA